MSESKVWSFLEFSNGNIELCLVQNALFIRIYIMEKNLDPQTLKAGDVIEVNGTFTVTGFNPKTHVVQLRNARGVIQSFSIYYFNTLFGNMGIDLTKQNEDKEPQP